MIWLAPWSALLPERVRLHLFGCGRSKWYPLLACPQSCVRREAEPNWSVGARWGCSADKLLERSTMKSPETENASIVMVGSFNPAIFQPLWLGTQDLIRRKEAEDAKI